MINDPRNPNVSCLASPFLPAKTELPALKRYACLGVGLFGTVMSKEAVVKKHVGVAWIIIGRIWDKILINEIIIGMRIDIHMS